MSIAFIIGAIFGVIFGLLLTGLIIMSTIKKSNDWGDLGSTEPSLTSFKIIVSDNKVRRSKKLSDIM